MGLHNNALRYVGSYRGVPFLFLVANCESEVHQLSVLLPANEDPWPVMRKLHRIFLMPVGRIDAQVPAALEKTDTYSHQDGEWRVEFERRGAGLLQFLSETIEAQR